MYLATKDGSSCRIPERKAAYYKSMGYSLEAWSRKSERAQLLRKKRRPVKKESATQEGVNPANS